MKIRFFPLLIVLMLYSCTPEDVPDTGIIPQPNSIEKKEGAFEISSSTVVYASQVPATQRVAGEFIRFIRENYGLELKMTDEKSNDAIIFERQTNTDAREGSYKLQIKRNKITRVIKKLKVGGVIVLKSYDIATGRKFIPGFVSETGPKGHDIVYRWIDCKSAIGEVVFNCLDEGRYVLGLREPGYGYKEVDTVVKFGERKVVEVKFDSSNKTGVYGYIKCKKTGEPVKNIAIGVYDSKDKGWVDMLTDENGYYRFVDMGKGQYTLIINKKEVNFDNKNWDKNRKIEKKVIVKNGTTSRVDFTVDCRIKYSDKLYNYKID